MGIKVNGVVFPAGEVESRYLKQWHSVSGWEPFSPPRRHRLRREEQL